VWFSNRRAKYRREEKLRSHNRHTRSSSSASSNIEPNIPQSGTVPQQQSVQSNHHHASQPTSHLSSGLASPDILSEHKFDINSSITNATSPSPATAATAAAAAAAAAAASAAVVASSSASRIPNPLSSGFANHSLYHTIPQPMPSMADTYR